MAETMMMPKELRQRVITGVLGVAALVLLIVFGGAFGIFLDHRSAFARDDG